MPRQDLRTLGTCLVLQAEGFRFAPNQTATKIADTIGLDVGLYEYYYPGDYPKNVGYKLPYTLEGYVVARLLVAALERVDGEPTAPKVSAALRASPVLDFGPMRVGGNSRYVDITAISARGGLVE